MDERMNVIDFKEAKCKNCYKCIRACEVKAITVKNEQAQILNDKDRKSTRLNSSHMA